MLLQTFALLAATPSLAHQAPFSGAGFKQDVHSPAHPYPRIDYIYTTAEDDLALAPEEMTLHSLHVSGPRADRYDLTFFSDGYTTEQEDKFVEDARVLTDDIISPGGALHVVSNLLNIYAVFVPSKQSGLGVNGTALEGSSFGLYRPGSELRAVIPARPGRGRAACRYWRENEQGRGGCDQPILLANDPLYGGLGGEFTVITASKHNGASVLRHELGHSLIVVGEEYEGGWVYSGVNAEQVAHLPHLKWAELLTESPPVIQDTKVPFQAYPWHDLSKAKWSAKFTSNNAVSKINGSLTYPTALIRISVSSIPYASHLDITLNGHRLDLETAFNDTRLGSFDRRFIDIPLENGLATGETVFEISLSATGRKARTGQGGKMISSFEMIEYGPTFEFDPEFIGAYPTFSFDRKTTLRPTNDGCLMRNVYHPTLCKVCQVGLAERIQRLVKDKKIAQARLTVVRG